MRCGCPTQGFRPLQRPPPRLRARCSQARWEAADAAPEQGPRCVSRRSGRGFRAHRASADYSDRGRLRRLTRHAPNTHVRYRPRRWFARSARRTGRAATGDPVPQHRGRTAPVVPRLRHERHRRPGAAGCPRWLEARASPGALRHERAGQHLQPADAQIRLRRRRSDGQVPPARRQRHLRNHRAHGAGLHDALSLGGRPRQLRLHRPRPPGGAALHRGADGADRRRNARGSGQRNRRHRPQLRRNAAHPRSPADAGAESARQRLVRHRRGHGHEHPAAQPRGSGRRLPRAARRSRHFRGRPDGAHPRPRLPHRRHHQRPRWHREGVPHRARAHFRARQGAGGERRQRQGNHRRRRNPVPGQQGADDRADR